MITSKELATDVCAAGELFIEALGLALRRAQSSCPPDEYEKFTEAVGLIIAKVDFDLLWPIYKKHPELEPESVRERKSET